MLMLEGNEFQQQHFDPSAVHNQQFLSVQHYHWIVNSVNDENNPMRQYHGDNVHANDLNYAKHQ